MSVIKHLPIDNVRVVDRLPLGPRTLDLARYMEKGGLVPPIHVEKCDGYYRVLDGRHRWAASKLVGRSVILVRVGK